jgi:tetratricopeptide (TPR) repeat protein
VYYEEAQGLAAALGDQTRLGWAKVYLSFHLWITGESHRACEFAAQAAAVGELTDDSALTVQAMLSLGATQVLIGDYQDADRHLERALGLATHPGSARGPAPYPEVGVRCWLAVLCSDTGQFQRGVRHARDAVRMAEQVDQPYSMALACWALGLLYTRWGRYDEATPLLERSIALARAHRIEILVPLATAYVGGICAVSGRIDEGVALLQESVGTWQGSGAFHSVATAKLGMAYLIAERWEDAWTAACDALARARAAKARQAETGALGLLGEIALRCRFAGGRAADEYFRQAIALADELGMMPVAAHCHLGLAKWCLLSGEDSRACEHLATAVAMFRQMDMRVPLQQAEALMHERTHIT